MLKGNYKLEWPPLGQGGFGSVVKGHHKEAPGQFFVQKNQFNQKLSNEVMQKAICFFLLGCQMFGMLSS